MSFTRLISIVNFIIILSILFRPFGFIAPKTLIYFVSQIFRFWEYRMKVILETRRVH